jgi:uncharacterized damage-inducible protein DinB
MIRDHKKGSNETMSVTTIRAMNSYDAWANERILSCCAQITSDQFTAETDIPWGSIRAQLVHQFIVHRRWLSWADGSLCGEDAYQLAADPVDYPDLDSVRSMWESLNQQNQTFMERLTSEDLERHLTVESPEAGFSIPVSQVLLHICHHSMQHRTETAVALTRFGASPGDIDYIFFALQQS